jgi:aspartate aminotransferase-like enzyme
MQLRIPGPTPLPDEVLDAMNRDMISHRSAEFRAMMFDITARLRHCFQTSSEVLTFPAAGTGGLEAAIANLFSPGDTVVSLTVGAFGERFAEIAERFGLDVV